MLKIRLIRWWQVSTLPEVHIWIKKENRPKGIKNILRVYFRKWFIHPLKRRIAKYYLIILRTFFGLKVIAITGSSGKTTTKEMTASILNQKGKTIASYANIDPVYNIPTTILKCTPSTKYLILEYGIEYPGEMDFYLWLAKPDVGVITNIYPTHTLFFGDEEGVAREKGKLVKALHKNNFAILNKDNKFLRKVGTKLKSSVIWFGENADVKAENKEILPDLDTKYTLEINSESTSVQIPIVGFQFVQDSLAAASVAKELGFGIDEIKKGLQSYKKPEHRMQVIKLRNGALVIDDSYNSNPSAAKEALTNFKNVVKKRTSIVVFGSMLELGEKENQYHKEIGKLIASYKFDYLIGVGKLSRFVVNEANKKMKRRAFWVESQEEVYKLLKPLLTKNSITLIKASRSVGLDKVVSQLL